MCNDTGRIIVGKQIRFILGILNSPLFFYSVKKFYGGGVLGEHGIRMKHTFFERFPCLKYIKEIEELAITLSNCYSDSLSDKLDAIIYSAYNLSEDESETIKHEIIQSQ